MERYSWILLYQSLVTSFLFKSGETILILVEKVLVVLYFAVHYQQTLQNSIWPTFAANKNPQFNCIKTQFFNSNEIKILL